MSCTAAAHRPVLYGGGGLINSGPEASARLTELVRRLDAPCTLTLMGLGAFPASDPHFLGMLRQWQQLHHGGRYSHSYTEALPDLVALAKAFGWAGQRVENPARLDQALDTCLSSPGPFLLDVAVEQPENCFPMIPAGRGHHEIMLSEKRWQDPAHDGPVGYGPASA